MHFRQLPAIFAFHGAEQAAEIRPRVVYRERKKKNKCLIYGEGLF